MKTRTKQLTVRFTPVEYAALKKKAEKAKTKMEPLVRDLVAGCEIVARDPEQYEKINRELSAIGRNINQIAHAANATGRVELRQITEVRNMVEEIRLLLQERL